MAIFRNAEYRLECDNCTHQSQWNSADPLPAEWIMVIAEPSSPTLLFCCWECLQLYARNEARAGRAIPWYDPPARVHLPTPTFVVADGASGHSLQRVVIDDEEEDEEEDGGER